MMPILPKRELGRHTPQHCSVLSRGASDQSRLTSPRLGVRGVRPDHWTQDMAARQAVLGMEQASFYYGSSPVFRRVSFLLDGARTALGGENGAGKSTLLKCLNGALELNGGKVVRSRRPRIGSVPQDVPQGLAERSVRDVLHASLVKVGLDEEYWRIDVLIADIGGEAATPDRPFGTPAGGRQRLPVAA